jgi:glycosyltransferase involved in cell wall biosynthesis
MVLVAPFMSRETYEAQKSTLALVEEETDGIRFNGAYSADLGRRGYLLQFPKIVTKLKSEIRLAKIVHAGPSTLFQPFEFAALLLAHWMKKKTIFITDIDQRQSAKMNYETGRWNFKEYVVTRILHDSYRHLQHLFASKSFSLVLLKGSQMAVDYGRGQNNVRNFLDSAFSDRHIIPEALLREKALALADKHKPVELVYFGRLVEYKGIDHMIRAVDIAVRAKADVRFHIIGDGPQFSELKRLSDSLGLGDHVVFHGAIPFGEALFAQLYKFHILLAAPLSEDTPRSALDAMASAQSIIAYDTYYYRELALAGAPVVTVPWRSVEALGHSIAAAANAREALVEKLGSAKDFAHQNTQEVWLDKRVAWTMSLFS